LEKKEFICSICNGLFREPVHTNNGQGLDDEACGHLFCEVCILRWLETNRSCPVCRKSLIKEQLVADVNLRRKIRNLPSICHIDSKRCKSKNIVGRDGIWWKLHDQECEYKIIKCPGCKEFVSERRQLALHLQTGCPLSRVGCRYQCGQLLLRKEIKEHENKCTHSLIECKQCQRKDIKLNKLKRHMEKECPEGIIKCDFASVGCKSEFIRKNEDLRFKHMTTEVPYHMSLLMSEITYLRAKLEGKFPALEDPEHKEPNEIVYFWSLSWVSSTTEVYSGSLVTAFGGQWGLIYGDDGQKEHNLVPIMVTCVTNEPITVRYAVAILHPLTGEQVKEWDKEKHIFTSNNGLWRGSGWKSMMTVNELEQTGAFRRSEGLTTLLFRARVKLLFPSS